MSRELIYLLDAIDKGYNSFDFYVDVKYTKTNVEFSKALISEGFIISFFKLTESSKKTSNCLRLLLAPSFCFREGRFKPYKFFSIEKDSTNKKNYYSYNKIRSKFSLSMIHIFSSDSGFITCRDALRLKTGGILVCKIWF